MDGQNFVAGIKRVVRDSAVQGVIEVLENPPGRRPSPDLVKQAAWYASLTTADKKVLTGIVMRAVDDGIFGFLCLLDGVRAIEDGPSKGDFVLNYVKGGTTQLNATTEPMLHDLYNDADIG